MIYDRMDPLTPIREPIVVNRGLSSINPEKHHQHMKSGKDISCARTFRHKRKPRIRVKNRDDNG